MRLHDMVQDNFAIRTSLVLLRATIRKQGYGKSCSPRGYYAEKHRDLQNQGDLEIRDTQRDLTK